MFLQYIRVYVQSQEVGIIILTGTHQPITAPSPCLLHLEHTLFKETGPYALAPYAQAFCNRGRPVSSALSLVLSRFTSRGLACHSQSHQSGDAPRDEDEEEVALVEHKPEGCNSPLMHHGNHQ